MNLNFYVNQIDFKMIVKLPWSNKKKVKVKVKERERERGKCKFVYGQTYIRSIQFVICRSPYRRVKDRKR